MSRYSGSTSFEFEVERYVDSKTGTIYSEYDESIPDLEYKYYTLDVTGNSYFVSGKLSGPPDRCFPDEGDTEIESVIGPDGKDWVNQITSLEESKILEMIQEKVSNQEPDYDEDDAGDDYWDDDPVC